MAKVPSITVAQYDNPKHNPGNPKDDQANPVYIYRVLVANNTLRVHHNQQLTMKEVQDLIDSDYTVRIEGPKA